MSRFYPKQRIEQYVLSRRLSKLTRGIEKRLNALEGDDRTKALLEFHRLSENCTFRIAQIKSARLVRQAIRLGIEIPDPESYTIGYVKEERQTTQCAYLDTIQLRKLKRSILIERRATWEFWLKVIVPILTAVTGAVGVIIGLVAILKTH